MHNRRFWAGAGSKKLVRGLAAATLMVGIIAPARAQERSPDARTDATSTDVAVARGLSRAFQSVARKVDPSVVHITQLNRVVRRDFFGFPLERGGGNLMETGLGSGVIVSREGYILTNNHVAGGAEALRVKLSDGSEHEARLVGRDPATDIAVIKIDDKAVPSNLEPPAFADSDAIEIGEWVVAIGSPFGFDNSVTAGIVSAKGRSLGGNDTLRYQDFIQTDAAINPGNSGGPLLNLDGRIVGINTAIVGPTRGYAGLGFAIPATMAKSVMESLIRYKRVVRGAIGVELEGIRSAPNARAAEGVSVVSVVENGPADKAGLKEGDVIVKVDGRTVTEPRLRAAIALAQPESALALDVLRDGETRRINVTVADQRVVLGRIRIESLGITVETFTGAQAKRRGFQPSLVGALIVEVDPDSRAAASGLEPDDLLVEARRPAQSRRAITIENAKDLENAATGADLSQGLRLGAVRLRNGTQGYVVISD